MIVNLLSQLQFRIPMVPRNQEPKIDPNFVNLDKMKMFPSYLSKKVTELESIGGFSQEKLEIVYKINNNKKEQTRKWTFFIIFHKLPNECDNVPFTF